MSQYKCEEVLPYGDEAADKAQQVEQMFDHIAPQYDPMNRLMSLFCDRDWRKAALQKLTRFHPRRMLDVATGTADFAINAYEQLEPETIEGIDLSAEMIEIGRKKVEVKNLSRIITLRQGDSLALPYADGEFDAVTVAFGVRNFADLAKGLDEMCRVTKPGGHAVILELSEPTNAVFHAGYKLYTKYIIPLMAKLVAHDDQAYSYLPASIAACPQGEEMAELLRKSGFAKVEVSTYTFGACSLYFATKATEE